MASWLSHIGDVFHSVIDKASHIFTSDRINKALDVAKYASDLVVYAAPYVEMLAAATPSPVDDIIVKAAEKLNTTVQDVLSDPDPAVRKGKILTLVGEATKLKLSTLISAEAGKTVHVGPLVIKVPADIDKIAGHLFDLAAQFAYSMFVKQTTVTA